MNRQFAINAILLPLIFLISNCGGSRSEVSESFPPLDTARIEAITGIRGTENNGEYKIAVAQNDLNVSVDGFRIIPPMGLTSWAGFTPAPEGAMVMGDLVVLEDEIGPVQEVFINNGMTVTAIHNHFIRDNPKVMFMHFHGIDRTENLASTVKMALDKVRELRTAKGLTGEPSTVANALDTDRISAILGHSGALNAGVYKITVGRPDVSLTDHGIPVSTFMGFNTWMAFQGSPQNAAVAGDFTMLEHEVAPVIQALVSNGIEVVAVHNHMTTESPRTFFLHFWGAGPAEDLANGLKAGLDQIGN